jgi:hypothetical protein
MWFERWFLSSNAKYIAVLYLISALFARLYPVGIEIFIPVVQCDAGNGWGSYFLQDNPRYYPIVCALLIWAILLPLVIEVLHLHKDNLNKIGKRILVFLWWNLNIQMIILVIYTFNIIVHLLFVFYHVGSFEISGDFPAQHPYAYGGIDSACAPNQIPNMNVSLSTNDPTGSSGGSPTGSSGGSPMGSSGGSPTGSSGGSPMDSSGGSPTGSSGGSPMDISDSDDVTSSDKDSAIGSSIGSEGRTSSEIDRNMAIHVEIDVLEGEIDQRKEVLAAMEARDVGATLTAEQTALLDTYPEKDSYKIADEIYEKEKSLHQKRVEIGESTEGESSEWDSSEGESSQGDSSEGEMRRAMEESRQDHRDHYSNKTGESSKKGGSK